MAHNGTIHAVRPHYQRFQSAQAGAHGGDSRFIQRDVEEAKSRSRSTLEQRGEVAQFAVDCEGVEAGKMTSEGEGGILQLSSVSQCQIAEGGESTESVGDDLWPDGVDGLELAFLVL